MEPARLLDCLADEFSRLREAVLTDPTAAVPTCPGWTVTDLARHLANGYLNVVVRRVRMPEETPRQDLGGEEPVAALDRCYAALTGEFAARSPDEPVGRSTGETVLFWIRRMAHETAIHRVDAELAVGTAVAPLAPDLALDGVEEMLQVFIEYETRTFPEDYAAHLGDWGNRWVLLSTGGRGWRVTVRPDGAVATPADSAGGTPAAVVSGAPADVQLWLWSRGGDVTVTGDGELVSRFRRLLAAGTGIS
jgi:uncharacterized protein (TIGR03083 family)